MAGVCRFSRFRSVQPLPLHLRPPWLTGRWPNPRSGREMLHHPTNRPNRRSPVRGGRSGKLEAPPRAADSVVSSPKRRARQKSKRLQASTPPDNTKRIASDTARVYIPLHFLADRQRSPHFETPSFAIKHPSPGLNGKIRERDDDEARRTELTCSA